MSNLCYQRLVSIARWHTEVIAHTAAVRWRLHWRGNSCLCPLLYRLTLVGLGNASYKRQQVAGH